MKITIRKLKTLIAEAIDDLQTKVDDDVDQRAIQENLEKYVDSWLDARKKTVYADARRPTHLNPEVELILKKTRATLIDRINSFTMYLDEQVGAQVLKAFQAQAARRAESFDISVRELRSLIREEIINSLS